MRWPWAILGPSQSVESKVDSRPAVVTISSVYGTRGEYVGREVAARLNLPFLDRAIPATVASEVMSSFAEISYREHHPVHGLSQWMSFFSPLGSAWLGIPEPLEPWRSEREYLDHTEAVMRRAAGRGVVILGRGAAVVLRDHPAALHVRLDGPPAKRLAQALSLGAGDEAQARRAQKETDSARRQYLQHFYRVDVREPSLYHLYLDATAIPTTSCVDLIVAAALARVEACGRQDGEME